MKSFSLALLLVFSFSSAFSTSISFEECAWQSVIDKAAREVCNQCGESYFDEAITKLLYASADEAFKNGSELEVLSLKAA